MLLFWLSSGEWRISTWLVSGFTKANEERIKAGDDIAYCSCPDRHAGQLDSSAINTELKDRVKKSEASHAKRRDTSNALSTL